jgi:antitoxin CcdA
MRMATKARKVPTNLSVREDLVRRAKELEINLSEVLDAALEEAIRREEQHAWLEANKDAIAQYNEFVEKNGVFSDDWRRF